ncbi:hypothetical protein [Enterococcus malodoratus]|uniref:hypothetical protein n=1 Tax=Enterococcus malodoratus TaxID=71451 RepID=UPI002073F39C|nr:hypothetical protein [Enterococcus malodoratus]
MRTEDISTELLTDVKDKLYVSWSDNDEQIKKIILRASKYIQLKITQELSFTPDSEEYELMLERCRYDWNNALDEFEKNYSSEILALIQSYALKDWRDNNVESTN